MPIYEYNCTTCGRRVEVLVRSKASVPCCPNCDSPLTDKLFSVPNILSGQTKHPAGQPCCGEEELCDELPCSYRGECRHN
jgi:putative FmdB family regulatory protein